MTADEIQAFVARCLVDPGVLLAILRGSNDIAGLNPSVRQLFDRSDLERVALFQAFIVKVKHSSLRDVLPLTFRMLPALGEELAFYQSYAEKYLTIRAEGPLPIERQVDIMAEDLRRYLEQCPSTTSTAISDVLTHELTLWNIHTSDPAAQTQHADNALSWRGRMEMHRYATDVSRACVALKTKTFQPSHDLAKQEQILAYWRPQQCDTIEFFEIDELTAALFSMVDGFNSLDDVAEELAAREVDQITPTDLGYFFGELVEKGFIEAYDGTSLTVLPSAKAGESSNAPDSR